MARRFIIFLTAWVLALGASLGAVSYLVDPSGIFYWFDPSKPALCPAGIYGYARATKPYAFVASRLRAIALGTSQVEVGVDVSDPYLVSQIGPAFNLALPSANMRSMAGFGIEAMSHGMVHTIVIGLSYGMFESEQLDSVEALPTLNSGIGTIAVQPRTLFTREFIKGALRSVLFGCQMSVCTIAVRLRALFAPQFAKTALLSAVFGCQVPMYRVDGQLRSEIYSSSVSTNSWKTKREEMPDGYLKQYVERKRAVDAGQSPYEANLQALRAMVETAARTHTRLIMFVTPQTAPFLEILRQTGHQERFELWKRDLGALPSTNRNEVVAPVRDFAVHSTMTDDPFPTTVSSTADSRWFLELNHFTPAFGALTLRRLFQEDAEGDLFGAPLEPATIDAHLRAARMASERYRASHPQDVDWIERRAAVLRGTLSEAR